MIDYIVIFLSIGLFSVGAVEPCPPSDSIKPCKCYAVSRQIRCEDLKDTELNAGQLKNVGKNIKGEWNILYIHNTKIAEISTGTFELASFKKIFIESNSELQKIAIDAFSKTTKPITFSVRGSAKLNQDSQIFKLIESMGEDLEYVELDQNGITKIPEHAFLGTATAFKNLAYIRLDNQKSTPKLTTIEKNAFSKLPALTQLSLDGNEIVTIGEKGIDLSGTTTVDNKPRHVSIFLNNNKLTEKQLTNTQIVYDNKAIWTLGLVLDNNDIKELDTTFAALVGEVASKGGKVYLTSNSNLKCKCDDVKQISQFIANVQGLKDLQCDDSPKKAIEKCYTPTHF